MATNKTKTVDTNALEIGSIMLITGKVDFCRITSQIAGEELARQNEASRMKGYTTEDRPYTTITIREAQPIVANPQALTPAETYITEAMYMSNAHPEKGYLFRGKNVGKILPWVGVTQAGTTNVVNQIKPEGELAEGLNVTLVLRVYKGQRNNGVGLEGVIVNEPIRYFSANDVQKKLKDLGITFVSDPTATTVVGDNDNAQPAAVPFSQPAPQAPQYQAPPFTAQPQAPQVQPPMPQQAPMTNPYAVPQATQPGSTGGITYNPADRNY